jgi:hypothetical protein
MILIEGNGIMSVEQTITIQAKVPGQKKQAITNWHIPLPPDVDGSRRMTLRDLIEYVVSNEIQTFHERQEERRLARILSPSEIELGVEKGKIDMGERDLDQTVDENAAIGAALQAFEDGLYFVFLDDAQQHDLNHEVVVAPDSTLLFIRLVALAGG